MTPQARSSLQCISRVGGAQSSILFALAVVILLALPESTSANISFNHPSLSGNIYAPVLRFNGGITTFEALTSRVVLENDTAAAQNDVTKRGGLYSGAIVLAKGYPWRTFFPWMHNIAIPGGAIAVALYEAKVVMITADMVAQNADDAIGWSEFLTAPHATNFSIPVIALSRPTFTRIEQVLASLNATERAEIVATVDSNGGITPWRQILTSPLWWVVSIFVAASACAMAAFAFIRFRDFYLALGLMKWGVPQTVLVLNFIPSIIRFMYWSIDPMFQRSIFPQVLHTPWRTWSFPFTISSMLVLVFYWFESVNQTSLRFSWNIERYRWPCYILIAISYILMIAASILYYTGADAYAAWLIDYVEPGYYLLVGLCLGLFYVVTAAKILLTMKKLQLRETTSRSSVPSNGSEGRNARKREKASTRIRSTAIKLVAMGGSFVSIVFIGCYTLNRQFLDWVPNHNVYTWAIMNIMLNVNAFCTILVLVPPRQRLGSTTKPGTTTSSQTDTSISKQSAV